ncbi:MAG: hypothetical protein ACJARD_001644 [Alphaproteobacteria bacterium]|jgi:hypothetical protein
MQFLKKLFGNDTPQDTRSALDHPEQLRKGDIVKFGFLDQQDLSNQRFEVVAVNSYDFSNEKSYCLTLKGEKGNNFWLSTYTEDGEEYLCVSKKLSRGDVKTLFNEDAFAEVFEEGTGTELQRLKVSDHLVEWTAPLYTEEEDCAKGYYHDGDYRDKSIPQYADEASALDYYLLEDDNEAYAIEIEVYEDGDTEVSATIYLDISVICEMWPGDVKQSNE